MTIPEIVAVLRAKLTVDEFCELQRHFDESEWLLYDAISEVAYDVRPDLFDDEDTVALEDPSLSWCVVHREELAQHPNAHIAITLDDGILFASQSDEDFEQRLRALDASVRAKVFLLHTGNTP